MSVFIPVICPICETKKISKFGKQKNGTQRYCCGNLNCKRKTFILNYTNRGCLEEVKQKILEMAINGSGIRDTARVLSISPMTVIGNIKKQQKNILQVNPNAIKNLAVNESQIDLCCANEAEIDEMWSFVAKKEEQRWLWYAINHNTSEILGYVLGRRKDTTFLELKNLLQPFEIDRYFTDDWGAYARHLDSNQHSIGKTNTQKIERKNLTFRIRIKRLTRKTICFSKSIVMHDIAIGLFINKIEFGLVI